LSLRNDELEVFGPQVAVVLEVVVLEGNKHYSVNKHLRKVFERKREREREREREKERERKRERERERKRERPSSVSECQV